MLTGTNLQHANSYNIRIVLETIRLYAPLSRIEVARRTHLTAQTVTNITKRLLKLGLIIEAHRLQEGRGAPAIMLKLNPDAAFSVGLDFDKDHLTGVLLDLSGRIRQRESIDLNFPTPEEAMRLMSDMAHSLILKEGIDRSLVWGLGVGLPGPLIISKGSVVTNIANPQFLPGWNHVPVVQIMGDRLGVPVVLENNASAAAIGEKWYGEGRHCRTFFYVFFGAGLGGGLILNGEPYAGFSGNAGEIGYLPSTKSNYQFGNGSTAHAGMHFNLPLLYSTLQKKGLSVANHDDLLRLYEARDPDIMEWVEGAIDELIPLILSIEYLIDPEVIFFGGRIPDKIIQYFLLRISERLPRHRMQGKTTTPVLSKSKAGVDAAALGVATLPLYNSFAPLSNVFMKQQEGWTGDLEDRMEVSDRTELPERRLA
jgi:predicted NBD/HSP70 family sugar kinase